MTADLQNNEWIRTEEARIILGVKSIQTVHNYKNLLKQSGVDGFPNMGLYKYQLDMMLELQSNIRSRGTKYAVAQVKEKIKKSME